jgi:hypothetical protein
MSLEGTFQNGFVVLDPGSPRPVEGTRVEIAPRTGMEPHIRKTPGVCGGDACVGRRRIADLNGQLIRVNKPNPLTPLAKPSYVRGSDSKSSRVGI